MTASIQSGSDRQKYSSQDNDSNIDQIKKVSDQTEKIFKTAESYPKQNIQRQNDPTTTDKERTHDLLNSKLTRSAYDCQNLHADLKLLESMSLMTRIMHQMHQNFAQINRRGAKTGSKL